MDAILWTILKVSEYKLGLFEHAQNMSKQPARLAYIGNFINYLFCLPNPFPRSLGMDLKGSNIYSYHLDYQ